MLDALMNTLFGCGHRKTSFPLTPARRTGQPGSNFTGQLRKGTYVVCLDCGQEFDYNWKEMRVGGAVLTGLPARVESLSVAD